MCHPFLLIRWENIKKAMPLVDSDTRKYALNTPCMEMQAHKDFWKILAAVHIKTKIKV